MSDVKGYEQISHLGVRAGLVTQVTLFPERQSGILVFTNQQDGAAFSAITNTIRDSYLGLPPADWVQWYGRREKEQKTEADRMTRELWRNIRKEQKSASRKADLSAYTGTYRDNWFGEVVIQPVDGKLMFRLVRSPKLTGNSFLPEKPVHRQVEYPESGYRRLRYSYIE